MTSPALRSSAVTDNNLTSSTAYPLTLPSGIVSGDWLVAFVQAGSSNGSVAMAISGWTAVAGTALAQDNGRYDVFYRKADGTEGSTVNVGSVGGTPSTYAATIACISGAVSTTPDFAATAAGSGAPDPPSVTPSPTGDDCLILIGYTCRGGVSTVTQASEPTGYTLVTNQDNTRAAYKTATLAGAEDPAAWPSSVSNRKAYTFVFHGAAVVTDTGDFLELM